MSDEESFVILGSSPLSSLHFYANSLHDGLEMEENGSVVEDGPQAQSNVDSPASLSQLSTLSEQTKSAEGSLPTTLPSQQTSLATGFLMGEVKPDVLKNSVYSQFPSLCSMQACAEDVVKLQTMMTEYIGLKQTLDKVNHTMQEYYKITQQWRQEAAIREQQYQDQLKQCQMQIEKLTVENQQLKKELETNLEQIRLVEDMHQKEHDDLRQSVSEKSSLINNMRVQIDKLQQHQLHSYDFVPDVDNAEPEIDIKREKHESQVKDLQRQVSELLAENLEIKDMKKTYVDEINCLKVNLTSAEELLNAMRVDVNQLRAKDAQKDEEIAYLKTQIDIYRRDFEMERADRQKNAGEKEQYLVDLRALQRRNQELIESLAEVHNSKKVIHTATGAVQSSLRAEQRPVRVLDPTGAAARTSDSFMRCPICLKSFSSLSVLQSHVNDCLDKN
ncbi:NF-kappa-B essential modulator isoform X2 [Drosophila grimshawi]|uniref:NF-kappa-B essential modulator isoform X2 n=1 Tax=Drosophila grimshawi TaxID=7222 RepID=UPI000C86FE55|nr:NF-kappa-B essential modulator isoform X2 [Drosophila grimshawi]XP_032590239.1 NF-kappa-B essential modulator isoform X2 [Drosophila grimshawi]XP_032590240.1 NF-kappa-B essential modulator isoform X2 [Drosophila grimshawi]XP_032590242.1 NF-kappa-B essential modulator isoform X2 [Drosophila grimshawi]